MTRQSVGGDEEGLTHSGAGAFAEMPDQPQPTDKVAWRAYWQLRQNAIPIDLKGDILEPHEVRAMERLVRAGEIVEWICKRKSEPTNDFVWLRVGRPTELKSCHPRAERIQGRIEDAVRKADRQGVVKDTFLIDIDTSPLTADLETELARYNVGRQKYRINDLWVMHSDGRVTHVRLHE